MAECLVGNELEMRMTGNFLVTLESASVMSSQEIQLHCKDIQGRLYECSNDLLSLDTSFPKPLLHSISKLTATRVAA